MNDTVRNYEHLVGIYKKVEVWCAYILAVLSPGTVIANGAFLLALYRNTRSFRKTPTIAFIAGLSIADFFTGLLVEPAFATHYIMIYYRPNSSALQTTKVIYTIGGTISTVAISTSYVTVLAMSLSQYIAIKYPHKYKTIVTTKRVVRLLILSGFYFLGFSLIQFTSISRETFLLLDVILHPTLISCSLIVVNILIRQAFKENITKPAKSRIDTLRLKELSDSSRKIANSSCTFVSESPRVSYHAVVKQNVDTCKTSTENAQSTKKLAKQPKSEDYKRGIIGGNNSQNTSNEGTRRDIAKGTKQSNYQRSLRRKPAIEKQFALMSFYLSAILLVSSISHAIAFYIFLLKTPENVQEDVSIHISLRVTDAMLFFKVFLDAFIFAWRLPGFKKILKNSTASNFL